MLYPMILRPFLPDTTYHNKSAATHPLLFQINRAGCSYCDNDFSITRKKEYPYYTIHYIFDGCGFFHISGQDYLLKKGDIFLISPNQAHTYRNSSSDPLGMIWLELSGGMCREIFSSIIHGHGYTFTNVNSTSVLHTMASLLKTLKDSVTQDDFLLSSQVYTCLMELFRLTETAPTQGNPYVDAALFYIHEHSNESIHISELADSLHISSAYLIKLFREHIGVSPLKYLHLKRVEYACLLLRTTQMSIEEISNEVGMYDSSSFCHLFKKIYSITPAKYRQNCHRTTSSHSYESSPDTIAPHRRHK